MDRCVACTAHTMAVWVVLMVTVDRYIAICQPFNPQLRSVTRVRVSVLCVALAAVLYNLPVCFEREIHVGLSLCHREVGREGHLNNNIIIL